MSNVSHASLTGSQLHEPKGADSASSGTVYVADGAGSGAWQSVGTSAFTGMIADFVAPIAPAGWLELNGSDISTSTFSSLYNVMTIQTSGTRNNGSPTITSLPSTSNFKVGYFVFGTGITSGTTILSIDSGTQLTLSANATSTGSGTFAVSPWLLNTGTIRLPDVTTNGRYRRSRTSTTAVGQTQSDQNQAHTHSLSVSGTTDSQGAHTHTVNISDPTHSHGVGGRGSSPLYGDSGGGGVGGGGAFGLSNTFAINAASTGISASTVSNGAHTHSVTSTGTSGSNGGTEARPTTLIVLTCVKT